MEYMIFQHAYHNHHWHSRISLLLSILVEHTPERSNVGATRRWRQQQTGSSYG
jgi:hypothetical protein